jgi:APA family basic amino acid/polyamine antiporter
MVVGTIIGASIFVQPAVVTAEVPSIWGVTLAWALAGLLTLAGALICAELTSAFPSSGGVYVFLREAYAPAAGFLWGWAMFWSMHSGIIAAIAVVFARFLAVLVPLGDLGVRVAAIAAIVALSVVNYMGVALGSVVQTTLTIAKGGAILLIVALGFWLGAEVPTHFVGSAHAGSGMGVGALASAVGAGLFAFGGWHMVTYTAEETRHAERTIPRALVLGTGLVTLAYVALNAVYLYVLPLDHVIASDRVAGDAADVLAGPASGRVVAGVVAMSALGALAGIVLTGPRVYFAMARDGTVFRWIGAVHSRFGVPHRAILLQAAWASVLVATGTYRALFTQVVTVEWLFFAALAAGLMRLRRHASYAPAFRVKGGALVPFVFAGAAILVAVNLMLRNPGASAGGLFLVAAGIPAYLLWRRWEHRGREGRAAP